MEYKFTFEGKEYNLNKDNIDYFINDDINPILDINEEIILEILNGSEKVDFSKAYFDLPCSNCMEGTEEKKKFFDFLGYNFYIYTKDGSLVISNIDKEYEGLSFNRLQRSREVDSSYIVTINVCKHCGTYSIEIEEFEI